MIKQKSADGIVVKTNESKFLGFTFQGGRIHWHPKTLQKFKQRVRRLTNRNWGVSMTYQLFKLSQYLHGWINYFGIASGYQRCVDLDQWILKGAASIILHTFNNCRKDIHIHKVNFKCKVYMQRKIRHLFKRQRSMSMSMCDKVRSEMLLE